jgi:hypothetical protein
MWGIGAEDITELSRTLRRSVHSAHDSVAYAASFELG